MFLFQRCLNFCQQKLAHRCWLLSIKYSAIALTFSLIIVACNGDSQLNQTSVSNSQPPSDSLTIWWNKGYLLEEDEALQKIVRDWGKISGKQVKLFFETEDELPQKSARALTTGNLPDLLFSTRAEYELIPRLAWEGKLTNLAKVIAPVENLYSPAVLESVYLYNQKEKQRSYYAVPIYQATIYIHYWQDLIEKIGKNVNDIPQDWTGFWQFWENVQEELRSEQNSDIYSLGITLSDKASDSYYFFEQVLEAYNVEIVDREGNLQVDKPEVQSGISQSLDWITALYKQGYIPPNAPQWLNPDNNFNMLNRKVVMTPNPTLSIPAAQREDEEVYFNQLGTLEFPNKPNGEPMRYIVSVRQAVVFRESKNQEAAQEFLAYLVQPETLTAYLKAATGRYFPVMTPAWEDEFWHDRRDRHIAIATKMLTERPTRPLYYTRNPAYTQVLEEHIWGKAINRILIDDLSPEEATQEAIARIEEIFEQWE
ncbi:ABC transporter substrate-binding protein [Oscillatoria salina]|uniref:ABC transporter substrate-binding protein n=1 Tax=Oscillatoria salina TaxID=331517 RepID=UPI0013B5D9BD|nr:ABC transporter substrate-binding protein [Oscillatoria salina]MBZ8182975.1 carbohydrate ABC transporter substrate-binding protein [Oscillatoria salina IIICB1]NET86519.1 carbohydrate ABC transporter substrate-binding protein [Kamptonema sp. SIO1D9]